MRDVWMYRDNNGMYILTIDNTIYEPMTFDAAIEILRRENL